jgi:hypothetical protein
MAIVVVIRPVASVLNELACARQSSLALIRNARAFRILAKNSLMPNRKGNRFLSVQQNRTG